MLTRQTSCRQQTAPTQPRCSKDVTAHPHRPGTRPGSPDTMLAADQRPAAFNKTPEERIGMGDKVYAASHASPASTVHDHSLISLLTVPQPGRPDSFRPGATPLPLASSNPFHRTAQTLYMFLEPFLYPTNIIKDPGPGTPKYTPRPVFLSDMNPRNVHLKQLGTLA